MALHRFGYGAMQLTGSMAFGPPEDRAAAIGVVQEAVRLGINHIDTADFYGPNIANEILREALHPYPKDLVIATKVGTRRGRDKSWIPALSSKDLTQAVHDNLAHLGLEVLDIVYLRVGNRFGPNDDDIAESVTVLAELQAKGVIRHLGLSNVSRQQFHKAQLIANITCVQNQYNLAHRRDDPFIDELAERGIAFVPFFPLGGLSPLQSVALNAAAETIAATPRQLALAWLLQRSPNILAIAGTSSVKHLRENLKATQLVLAPDIVSELDTIAPPQ